MAIKVRIFADGKQVDPAQVTISNITVSRIINDVVARMTPMPESKERLYCTGGKDHEETRPNKHYRALP
jgi:hypothetical protein